MGVGRCAMGERVDLPPGAAAVLYKLRVVGKVEVTCKHPLTMAAFVIGRILSAHGWSLVRGLIS